MRRRLTRPIAALLVVALLAGPTVTPVRAQVYDYLVYDDANWYQAVLQLFQIVEEFRFLLQQARRLSTDIMARYHGHAVDWTLHDLDAGLRYAQRILGALNTGDPTGVVYREGLDSLDVPTDVLARMPASLQRRLRNAYAAIETADSVSALAVDQMGTMRMQGPLNAEVVAAMEADAVSTEDDFHTQTALLNKINAAGVLGLRIQDHMSKTLVSLVEQLIVTNQRQRDADALVLNATIAQWRYGQAYGEDLFRNTAANIDSWRLR